MFTHPNKEFAEITESIEALTKKVLSQKTEELNAILESSSDGILVLDHNDRILHYNRQFLLLWGIPTGKKYTDFAGLNLKQYIVDATAYNHPIDQTPEVEIHYLKSGIILERYTQLLSEREHIDGILCVFRM